MSKTDFSIVLDVDETLINMIRDNMVDKFDQLCEDKDMFDVKRRAFDIRIKEGDEIVSVKILKRPHLDKFLRWCFTYFNNVIIWSAGTKPYVKSICEKLFSLDQPVEVWTRENCAIEQNGNRTKPLINLISNIAELQNIDLSKTFILEDRYTAFSTVNQHNGVLIPPFEPKIKKKYLKQDDRYLLDIIDWFEKQEVKEAEDIRLIDKPFDHIEKY